MGLPPNGVLTWFFLKFLESGPFKSITSKDSRYFCYIDNILFIFPQNINLEKFKDKSNKIEPSIDLPSNKKLRTPYLFLDTSLINNNRSISFLFSVLITFHLINSSAFFFVSDAL